MLWLVLPLCAVAGPRLEHRSTASWAGGERVRVSQVLGDLPVEGRDLILAQGPKGEVRVYGRPVLAEAPSLVPSVGAKQAELAAQAVAAAFGEGMAWTPRSELVAWVDPSEKAHLAWAVDVSTAQPLGTFRVLVHAHTGEVLATQPTSRSALGRVYAANPLNSDLVEVELQGLLSEQMLSGEYVDAWSCDDGAVDDGLLVAGVCEQLGQHALPDEAGDYLFDPDPSSTHDPMAEVHVYHHIDRVSAWFHNRWGFRHADPMRAIVNFEMTNAFWGDFDGDGVPDCSFGQSPEGVDFGYDADVIYHEFGHSVVHGVSTVPFLGADEFGLVWDGGGLDEGSADTVAMLLTGDPLMAEYAGSYDGLGEPIRDLSEPRRCPDDLFGESHYDGEIFGTTIWQIIDDPLLGDQVAAELWWGAVTTWTTEITWARAGTSLLDSAADMLGAGLIDQTQHDAIADHLELSGMLDCGRVLPLDDGAERSQYMINLGLLGDYAVIPLGVQFSIEVPEGTHGLRFSVPELRRSSEELGFVVYVRRGEHIVHEADHMPGLGLAFAMPVEYDAVFDAEGGPWSLELTADTPELALQPGETYYFALGGANLGGLELMEFATGVITVQAELFDAPDEEEEPGGCGCAWPGAPAAGWLGLGLLGLATARRRRR